MQSSKVSLRPSGIHSALLYIIIMSRFLFFPLFKTLFICASLVTSVKVKDLIKNEQQ